jgi:hypothetical protein
MSERPERLKSLPPMHYCVIAATRAFAATFAIPAGREPLWEKWIF